MGTGSMGVFGLNSYRFPFGADEQSSPFFLKKILSSIFFFFFFFILFSFFSLCSEKTGRRQAGPKSITPPFFSVKTATEFAHTNAKKGKKKKKKKKKCFRIKLPSLLFPPLPFFFSFFSDTQIAGECRGKGGFHWPRPIRRFKQVSW
eukprot:TRINITY_DN1007_c2_g2_i6.p1 TRINITY_DN1007_c2_g2~~TRINITY_DN1007_c2_g2_i6.p1  ORF type:complete len:147 (+),score=6.09 TRINITY_DN1007_c2_g2_i6:128-568(+)